MPTELRSELSKDDRNEFSSWLSNDPEVPINWGYLEYWLIEVKDRDVKRTEALKEEARKDVEMSKPTPTMIRKHNAHSWRVFDGDGNEIYEASRLSECKDRFGVEDISRVESGVYEIKC